MFINFAAPAKICNGNCPSHTTSIPTPTPTPSGLSCCYCCFFIGYWGVLGRVSVDNSGTPGCSARSLGRGSGIPLKLPLLLLLLLTLLVNAFRFLIISKTHLPWPLLSQWEGRSDLVVSLMWLASDDLLCSNLAAFPALSSAITLPIPAAAAAAACVINFRRYLQHICMGTAGARRH